MPKNTKMFSNKAALDEGYNRVVWKNALVKDYFSKVNYSLSHASSFDHREISRLISLIVDMGPVEGQTEEAQREYFNEQIRDIEQNFILSNDINTKLPYIRRLYERAATTNDIDWDNPAEIDNLLCSVAAQQMLGTVMERMTAEVMAVFNTKDEVTRLDNISISNYANMMNMQNYLLRHDRRINEGIEVGANDTESYNSRIATAIFLPFAEATKNGSNVVNIDPSKVDVLKKHFLGDEFEIHYDEPVNPNDPENKEVFHMTYNSNDTSKDFLTSLFSVWSGTVNELLAVRETYPEQERNKLLFINGRTVFDLVSEKIQKDGMTSQQANIAVGKMLRDAMTDGRSIVSLMRPTLIEGGQMSFVHQEVKIDLDALNKMERNEKHNVFRRALDFVGIWKIKPKFSSNQEREAQQQIMRADETYKQAFKNAENEFIDTFNSKSRETREAEQKEVARRAATNNKKPVARNMVFQLFPEVRAVENVNENVNEINNNALDNEPARVQLPPIMEVIEEEDIAFGQIIDDDNKSLNMINNI